MPLRIFCASHCNDKVITRNEDGANPNLNYRDDHIPGRRSLANRHALLGDQPFPHMWAIISGQPTDFTLDVSDPVDPATLDASDFTVNGIPADSFTLLNNNTVIDFIFNTSPAVPGINTMHIPTGAFNCGGGPVLEFICTFGVGIIPPRPFPTPHPRPTP